jgi:hypothetical protein
VKRLRCHRGALERFLSMLRQEIPSSFDQQEARPVIGLIEAIHTPIVKTMQSQATSGTVHIAPPVQPCKYPLMAQGRTHTILNSQFAERNSPIGT